MVSRILKVGSGGCCNALLGRNAAVAEPSMDLQNVPSRRKLEFADQTSQPSLATGQVRVVPEARPPPDFDSWLTGINFPWMKIKDERDAFGIYLSYRPLRDPIREDAEIATAGDGQSNTWQLHCRRRKLNEASAIALHEMRCASRTRDAIQVMAYRKDARVVYETRFNQGVERPQ